MEDYNTLLQQRADKGFNVILRVASLLAFIAAYILYIANIPKGYAFLNFSAGIICLVFSLFAHKIQPLYKIVLLIFLSSLVAVASFIGGSFYSAFNILLVLSNVLAMLFLRRKKSILVSFYSVGVLCVLCYYSVFVKTNSDIVEDRKSVV